MNISDPETVAAACEIAAQDRPAEDILVDALFNEAAATIRALIAPAGLIAVADMSKASAELMQYAWMMQKSEDFNGADCDRVREIAGWLTIGAPSDLERQLVQCLGAILAALRSSGMSFDESAPFAPQFLAFVDGLPANLSNGAFRMGARAMRDAIEADISRLVASRTAAKRSRSNTEVIAALIPVVAAVPLPTFPTREPAEPEGWAWWSGPDDEYYRNGPCGTREEAIAELDNEGGYIVEALPGDVRLTASRLISDQYFEGADDLFDYENAEPDRVGGVDQIAAADDELQALLDGWLERWRHTFVKPNMFRASRNEEYVEPDYVAAGPLTADEQDELSALEAQAESGGAFTPDDISRRYSLRARKAHFTEVAA